MAGDTDSTDADREPTENRESTKIESVEDGRATERTRLGDAAALIAAVAFTAVAGLPGLVAGVAVLAGMTLLGSSYAFALGQLGVAGLLSNAGVLELAAVEFGLVGALLAAVAGGGRREGGRAFAVESTLVALAWLLAGGTVAWAADRSLVGPSTGSLLLVAATGVAAYGLHRYQLVSLGKVGDARER